MAKLVAPNFDEKNQRLLDEIVKLKVSKEGLVETLYKYLPLIAPHVNPENRLVRVRPSVRPSHFQALDH